MTATKTMLSSRTIQLIQSTVPVLEQHGEQITKRFYELLFSNHPELLNIFNHAHQKQGQQQKALAAAVYAAAKHIDRLEEIVLVVKLIAHKHRSIGVKPEYYPIVGQHLLLAIKDVLGDAATDEIIEAWKEAYDVIAGVFIQVEDGMYKEAEEGYGGWKDYRKFVVKKKVKESDVITSFYLVPEDGKELAEFLPGQYVSMKVAVPGEEYTHIRQYSLSDAPNKGYYRISVKREAGSGEKEPGVVSNYLHDHINEGDMIELSAPAGEFVLDTSNEPIVFISGGVGITPFISMLNTVVERQPSRAVTFIHAAINGKVHAFDSHLIQLASDNDNIAYYICYQSPSDEDRNKVGFAKEGYIDLEFIRSAVKQKEAQFYFCGPVPFMKTVYHALKEWGVSEDRIHFEFFGPMGDLTA